MTTLFASADSGVASGRPSPAASWRQRWQVPTFVAGILALGLALLFRQGLLAPPKDPVHEAVAAALAAVDGRDYATAMQLASRAMELATVDGRVSGEVHFALGSAYLLHGDELTGPEKAEAYAHALQNLRQAADAEIPSEWQPRLLFRLAKAEYYTGRNLVEVAEALDHALDVSPADRVEGYALLTNVYLQQPQQNLERALRANEKLLAQAALKNPNPARLHRAELLLRRDHREEAREVLGRITPDAPEYRAAAHLIAQSWFQEGAWKEAAKCWEALTRPDHKQEPYYGSALFRLGECYANLKQADDALRVWQQLAVELPNSDETRAAAFDEADLHNAAGNDAEALRCYAVGLQTSGSQWQNRHLEISSLRARIDERWQRWIEAGKYESARRLARLYASVALPGQADRLFALASQQAGESLWASASTGPSAEREQSLARVREYMREAGEAFEASARGHEDAQLQADLFWRSAQCYLRAQTYPRAQELLEKSLMGDLTAARRREAQIGLAEAYHATGQPEKAMELLEQALVQPSSLEARGRYLLALTQMEKGDLGAAERSLRQLMAMPPDVQNEEELRLGLFALVHVLFRREQYADAAEFLERALDRGSLVLDVRQTRFWLAEAHRRAARQEKRNVRAAELSNAREFYQKLKRTRLEQALTQYRQLSRELEMAEESGTLAPAEQHLLRDAQFGMAECLCNLGQYQAAVPLYEALALRFPNETSGLTALMHLTHCQLTIQSIDQAQVTMRRARELLDRLGDKELEATQWTRKHWLEWLDSVAASAQPQEP